MGANIDQFARRMRRAKPETVIHSFEPIPEMCVRLAETFAQDNNFFAHGLLGDREGKAAFEVHDSPDFSPGPTHWLEHFLGLEKFERSM
jgi:FkbM family methyltransferase